MTGELRALTGARGIAAWLVVFFHIRHALVGVPAPAMRALDRGYLAVDFFFVLSGFVIWLAWHRRFAEDGWRAAPRFLRRRVARVWPLHLLVLSGGVALALLLAATGRHDPAEFPFRDLPLHVLLVQCWGFSDAMRWNDPAWSISAEFGAYLLFPLLAVAVDWRRMPSAALIAVAAGLALVLAAVMAGAGGLGDDIPRFGLLRCVCEFGMGTVVGALWWRWRDRPGIALPAAGIAAALLGAAAAGLLPEPVAVPAGFAALLLFLAQTAGRPGNPLEWGPLHWMGEISYAVYLGHFLLWTAFKLAFVRDAAAVPWPLMGMYLALVLASSALLYHRFERPAQDWVNRGPGRRRAPTARAADALPR